MRRVVLGAVAVLLTWGAFATQPTAACPVMDFCDDAACNSACVAQGYIAGACIGRPCTTKVCGCLMP
jgi:hypothetical protein